MLSSVSRTMHIQLGVGTNSGPACRDQTELVLSKSDSVLACHGKEKPHVGIGVGNCSFQPRVKAETLKQPHPHATAAVGGKVVLILSDDSSQPTQGQDGVALYNRTVPGEQMEPSTIKTCQYIWVNLYASAYNSLCSSFDDVCQLISGPKHNRRIRVLAFWIKPLRFHMPMRNSHRKSLFYFLFLLCWIDIKR